MLYNTTMSGSLSLDEMYAEVLKAEARLRPYLVETPVISNDEMNQQSERLFFFKCENLQRTGSFKARGALNAVLAYKEQHPNLTGVVSFSGGNHGLALAWAAKKCGLACKIVIPRGTAQFRMDLIQKQGAECVISDPSSVAAMALCNQFTEEEGMKYISPFDDPLVIAGQGTVGLELLRQVPGLDVILVSVCGGGLIAGITIVAACLQPKTQVCAVEPVGKNLQPCLEQSKRLWPNPPQFLSTLASVLVLQQCGEVTFPIMCRYTSKTVFTVSDREILDALRWTWENLKVVTEISGAAGVAAARSETFRGFSGKRVGVIICGGNCPVDTPPWQV